MAEPLLVGLALVLVFGISAQWLAWRFNLPNILLLLIFGLVAGPVTGVFNPDQVLGDLLLPIVSLSVAIILFEGGLSLKLSELSKIGGMVWNLVFVGALVSWVLSAGAAYYLAGLSFELALLLGAILVVTGPTVIVPLLRQIRPAGRLGALLKWEGIIIDPVGAILAVLVFEAVFYAHDESLTSFALWNVGKSLVIGLFFGGVAAYLIIQMLRRYLIPDFLQSSVTLMVVVLIFTASNMLQAETGLLAVTAMGMILANQNTVAVKHIIEFKENLRVILISSLFIILAARINPSDLAELDVGSFAFLAFLIFVVRPASVFAATFRANLTLKKKIFLSFMAPRGIVAAAVTSVLAFELAAEGNAEAEQLIPLVFMVILGTVTFYGIVGSPLAKRLGLSYAHASGVLIVGAHYWAREMALFLKLAGINVLLVDTNKNNIRAARRVGLSSAYASATSPEVIDELELEGLGHLLAVTSNDEVNTLSALNFREVFSRADICKLPSEGEADPSKTKHAPSFPGRLLFGAGVTYAELMRRFGDKAMLKLIEITESYPYEEFQRIYGEKALLLFLIDKNQKLSIATTDNTLAPQAGDTVICLLPAEED